MNVDPHCVASCDKAGSECSTLACFLFWVPSVRRMARPGVFIDAFLAGECTSRDSSHVGVLRWAGRLYLSHLIPKHHQKKKENIPELRSWRYSPHISCTDLFSPTQDCELATRTDTHTHAQGSSVTANCDSNEWKLVLPPLLASFLPCFFTTLRSALPVLFICSPWSLLGKLWDKSFVVTNYPGGPLLKCS